MRVCLLEPYDTGSHGAWLRGYAAYSRHQVTCLTLDGRFWKWRMHGGAVTLARRYLEQAVDADVLLASDMLDLSTFRALTCERTARIPAAVYMHENQLTYPLKPGDRRDLHYGFINYASMLCAQAVAICLIPNKEEIEWIIIWYSHLSTRSQVGPPQV